LDVQAGLEGGARVIAVATGTNSAAELRASGAHVVMTDLSNISDLVDAVLQMT
ncbi:MAG: HAD hydrolase-like protein, partial [Candidatus Dormibacteraceae bacterium]